MADELSQELSLPAAESIEAVFQAVLTAATQDGDMAAAKLLIDRVIPSRRGAPVSFHIRPLKTPEDCALAYADLLDDVGGGRLTPDEAQTIAAIVAKRAELFGTIELASEIDALKAQLAAVVGTQRAPTPIRRPFGSPKNMVTCRVTVKAERLLERAERLIALRDLAGARLLLERATSLGNRRSVHLLA